MFFSAFSFSNLHFLPPFYLPLSIISFCVLAEGGGARSPCAPWICPWYFQRRLKIMLLHGHGCIGPICLSMSYKHNSFMFSCHLRSSGKLFKIPISNHKRRPPLPLFMSAFWFESFQTLFFIPFELRVGISLYLSTKTTSKRDL